MTEWSLVQGCVCVPDSLRVWTDVRGLGDGVVDLKLRLCLLTAIRRLPVPGGDPVLVRRGQSEEGEGTRGLGMGWAFPLGSCPHS